MVQQVLPRRASRRLITRVLRDFVSAPRFDPSAPPGRDPAWPRITLVTPSFNQAPFLERTILSIHNQGYPNLEHIVMDGGSTDGSLEILHRYRARFAFFRSQGDAGQGDAINSGVERATGGWFGWVNSDDMLLPGALPEAGEALRAGGGMDVLYRDMVEVDGGDRVAKRVYAGRFDLPGFLREPNIAVLQPTALFRVELFRATGGLTSDFHALDYEMVWRMAREGARFRHLPGFSAAFRLHPGSQTGSGAVKRLGRTQRDAVFAEALGRRPNAWDRTGGRLLHKARRFLREPRALLGAIEHRLIPPPR